MSGLQREGQRRAQGKRPVRRKGPRAGDAGGDEGADRATRAEAAGQGERGGGESGRAGEKQGAAAELSTLGTRRLRARGRRVGQRMASHPFLKRRAGHGAQCGEAVSLPSPESPGQRTVLGLCVTLRRCKPEKPAQCYVSVLHTSNSQPCGFRLHQLHPRHQGRPTSWLPWATHRTKTNCREPHAKHTNAS